MRALMEYLTQYPVERVVRRDPMIGIQFQGGARLAYEGNTKPAIETMTLLRHTRTTTGDHRLQFGHANEDGIMPGSVIVTIIKGTRMKLDIPGFDSVERDLTIPRHPDERIATQPTMAEEG